MRSSGNNVDMHQHMAGLIASGQLVGRKGVEASELLSVPWTAPPGVLLKDRFAVDPELQVLFAMFRERMATQTCRPRTLSYVRNSRRLLDMFWMCE